MRELLMGDEAVATAAIDAGIRGAFSYPGTPATEIFECVLARAANDQVCRSDPPQSPLSKGGGPLQTDVECSRAAWRDYTRWDWHGTGDRQRIDRGFASLGRHS